MKEYYISGIIGGIVLFLISFGIVGCNTCRQENSMIDDAKEYAEELIVVRYYLSEDYLDSRVGFTYATKGEPFTITEKPTSAANTRFLGWYDSPNINTGRLVVDSNGNSIQTLQNDIILYPLFE